LSITKVTKRDGTITKFSSKPIHIAIEKAFLAVNVDDETLVKILTDKIVDDLNENYDDTHTPNVEEVQDFIENILMEEGHSKVAKAYILYRQKRSEVRQLKKNILGRLDDSKLDVNGLLLAKNRYLKKDESGQAIETPRDMFRRVAKSVADVEKRYDKTSDQIKIIEDEFYDIIESLQFLPSGRILANAGHKNDMIYSSYVIPIEDSMKGVFKALYHKALVQRLGGGTGFSFSNLRPKGLKLTTTMGSAAGPIAFIKLFDHASDLSVIGSRKPANMGSLSVEHPDIVEFITMKERREIRNFNISVEITDKFMEAVKNNEKYDLIDPSSKKVIERVDANNIFHLIVTMAWKTGDPGILFIDRINESNPVPKLGKIETTDPCGDQLLLPYEGGNLGAINLSRFIRHKQIQWKKLERVIRLAVRFLDNIVDLAKFPIKKIEDTVQGLRRIGLGIMGYADMLYQLRVPYNSEKALEIATKVMRFISQTAEDESLKLGEEKGVFDLWHTSKFYGNKKIRNASLIAIAPTGSRSILVDTSPGIEPNFALGYTRKIMGTTEILQINNVIGNVLEEYDLHKESVIRQIISTGNLNNVDLPEDIKKIFVTAHYINPEWHLKIQSIFQKYVDNAISKTINFDRSATIEDIKNSFTRAYELGCRGLTVYREGSLSEQVINIGR
jgi:ribonucleoside-diphosphate reductase alpha chain